MWDLRNPNKPRKELDQHTHAITGLQFHPGEMLLGSCSADKTVKVRTHTHTHTHAHTESTGAHTRSLFVYMPQVCVPMFVCTETVEARFQSTNPEAQTLCVCVCVCVILRCGM